MSLYRAVLAFALALSLSLTTAGTSSRDISLWTRNTAGISDANTFAAVGEALLLARAQGQDVVFNSTARLDKSWDGAVLFHFNKTQHPSTKQGNLTVSADITVTCTTCYIAGTATTFLMVNNGFNISNALDEYKSEVEGEVTNITTEAFNYIEQYIKNAEGLLFSADFNLDDYDLPPIDFNFNLPVPEIPQTRLHIQLDGLELYMEIDTIVDAGASYTLNLFTSETEVGIAKGDDLQLGAVLTVDLILSADAEVDISSGFHLKFDDGAAIDIEMFSQDVSSVTFNGGKFEFLPVAVSGAATLKAALRVGARAGLAVGTADFASAGVEAGVFAHVAEFVTNVTTGGSDCDLRVVEYYQFALGGAAGATMAFESHTWGPVVQTTVPIYTTTLADACAVQKTVAATVNPALAPRQGYTTTTIYDSVTYTGRGCVSTGLIDCPLSLQTTAKVTSTSTLVTSVPSGSQATFPATTQTLVPNLVAFGTSAKAMTATTGVPMPYSGLLPVSLERSSKAIGFGVGLGLGIPLVAALIAGYFYLSSRKKPTPPPTDGQVTNIDGPDMTGYYQKSPGVTVRQT